MEVVLRREEIRAFLISAFFFFFLLRDVLGAECQGRRVSMGFLA